MSDWLLGEVTRWSIYAAAAAAVLFPLLYCLSPWRQSAVGRALMTLAAAIATILALAALRLLGWIRHAPHWVDAALYVWLAVALWRHLWVLVGSQRLALRARRRK